MVKEKTRGFLKNLRTALEPFLRTSKRLKLEKGQAPGDSRAWARPLGTIPQLLKSAVADRKKKKRIDRLDTKPTEMITCPYCYAPTPSHVKFCVWCDRVLEGKI